MTRALPLLATHRRALETCGYCPKLCREACPVSNVEPRDTLTPWGKMSIAWLEARAELAVTADSAETAWACSGCLACSERCEHDNPVASTLLATRDAVRELGHSPPAVVASAARHAARLREAEQRRRELAAEPGVSASAPTALLVGCGYLRRAGAEARAIVRSAVALLGGVRLLEGCCGAPLAYAGHAQAARAAATELAARAAGARLVVADPGCATALAELRPETLIGVAAERRERLRPVPSLGHAASVRFHDPCLLGRGLSQYREPRLILERALGRPPEEFRARRERAECSGAGGLLPVAMPEVSRAIAAGRLAEHERLGGGLLVTGCAASLTRFRASGAVVEDVHAVLAQSLGVHAGGS